MQAALVVGGWARRAAACIAVAMLPGAAASAEVSFTGLGDLPGGAHASEAQGISADGSVVVGRATAEGGSRAFV